MRRDLVHDHAAQEDLVEIWLYTRRTWSVEQAERYLGLLEKGIAALGEEPEAGTSREELRPGYWSKRLEHHVVFYTFGDTEVRIRRVLHERSWITSPTSPATPKPEIGRIVR